MSGDSVVLKQARKTKLVKALDGVLGPLLARALPEAEFATASDAPPITRALFIRPGGLGDALVLLPVIEAFAQRFPDAAIDILAERRNSGAYAFLNVSHTVELYSVPGTFFRLRKRRYDVIIDTEQWYRLSAVYARLLNPRRLIGFATNERKRLLTDRVAYHLDVYERENFFHLLEPLEVEADSSAQAPFTVVDEVMVQALAGKLGKTAGQKWVAIFPGASMPEKCWPVDNYYQLVRGLQQQGCHVVIIGGASERGIAELIGQETGCMTLAGQTSLLETAGILVNTELLVTGDSAVLHLAANLAIPTVSLFGPSSPLKWAPQGNIHRALQENFDCVPCSSYGHIPPCPYGVRCLKTLAPAKVLDAAAELLMHGGSVT